MTNFPSLRLILWAMSLSLGAFSCSELQNFYDEIRGKNPDPEADDYSATPGVPASQALSKTLSNESVGVNAQLKALGLAIEDQANINLVSLGLAQTGQESTLSADQSTLDVLVGSEKGKVDLNPDVYQKLDESFFTKGTNLTTADYSQDAVTWGDFSDSEFVISVLDRMPVRDQGQRGTCASFAGIGLIESLVLKQASENLPFKEIDLAEQRFYFLSKPESWDSGGSTDKQGSDSGSGFMTSNGELSGYSSPSDTGGVKYNIPLESDCRYNGKLGTNDLQTPLAESCKSKGIIRVTKFTAWGGSKGGANTIDSAQSIYNELRKDKAVIVYTKLSKNWEKNDGIITSAAAGGTGGTGHATGHAYLIVGARKLNESAYPGEGGLCFVIRNSWGPGWGVKGISCMTLKWFNQWRFAGPFPTVDEIELITDSKSVIKIASSRPSGNLPEPDPSSRKNGDGGKYTRRRGQVSFLTGGTSTAVFSSAVELLPSVVSKHMLTSLDAAGLTAGDMNFGKLITGEGEAYKMLYTKGGSELVIRGIVAGDSKQTHSLSLNLNGAAVTAVLGGRGETTVGELKDVSDEDGATAVLVLCGGRYGSICELNYDEESNELIIGLTRLEAKRQVSVPPFSWQGINIAGYGIEVSKPASSLSKVDVRFLKDGNTSAPQRLKLDPQTGGLSHKGETVGNLQDAELCSGSFREKCKIVQTEESFEIFQRSR